MCNSNAESYRKAIYELDEVYKRGGFNINKIRCDNEFKVALDPIVMKHDPPIMVNYSNPQEHVPHINMVSVHVPRILVTNYGP